ncbi:MAG: tetratricopeptide repeat protein, partial [Nitrososphaeraceae archaeon]
SSSFLYMFSSSEQDTPLLKQYYVIAQSTTHNILNQISVADVITLIENGETLLNSSRPEEAISYYNKVLAIEPENTAALYGKGDALYDIGSYDEAISYFDKGLELEPNNVVGLHGMGASLSGLGKYEEAIIYYDKALTVDANFTDSLYNKALALVDLGRYEDAVNYYEKVLELEPNAPDALNSKGYALAKLGKLEEAVSYYDKAIEIEPNFVFPLKNKAEALFDLGKYNESVTYYDQALAIEPNNPDTLSDKGNLLASSGQYEEAIVYFDKVLALDPNDVDALYNKATALYILGGHEEAIGYYDKILAIEPDNVSILSVKGAALFDLGRYEEAIGYLDRALSIQPNNVKALIDKGAILNELTRHEEAIGYLNRALSINPNDVLASYNKANVLVNLGRYEEGIIFYDRVLTTEPDNPLALFGKGVALYDLGRYEEAISYYDKALAIEPDNLRVLTNKGNALYDLGRYEEAVSYYSKVLDINPNDVPALYNNGLALVNLGRYEEAISHYDKSFELEPNAAALNQKRLALDQINKEKSSSILMTANNKSSAIDTNTTFLNYTNTEYGFQIEYPIDWFYDKGDSYTTVFLPLSTLDYNENTTHISILTGIVNLPSQNIPAEDVLNELINSKDKESGLRILESNSSLLAGNPAHKAIFTEINEDNAHEIKTMQILTVRGDKAYWVGYVAPSTNYSNYIPIAQKMIDSFEIIEDNTILVSGTNIDTAATTTTNTDAECCLPTTTTKTINKTMATTPTTFSIYENPRYGIKMQYPADWQQVELTDEPYIFEGKIFNVVAEFYLKPPPNPSINIIVADLQGHENKSLDEFTREGIEELRGVFGADITFIESNSTRLIGNNGSLAHKVVYSFTDNQGNERNSMQVWTVQGDKGYIISYRADTAEQFSEYLLIAEKVIDSFSINSSIPVPIIDAQSTKFLTYDNPVYGFKMQYPSDWTLEEGFLGGVIGFESPQESAFDVLENLIVSVEDLPFQNMSLEEYVNSDINTARQSLSEFKLIESTPTTFAGQPAIKVVFIAITTTLTTEGLAPEEIKLMSVYTKFNDKAYIISYNSEPSKYSIYLPIIQKMIDSFEIMTNNTSIIA